MTGFEINGTIIKSAEYKDVFVSNSNFVALQNPIIKEAIAPIESASSENITQTIQTPIKSQEQSIYGALNVDEKIPMEDTPANINMQSPIAGPTIEEINNLRAVISTASDKLTKLTDELDELHQILQVTLDNSNNLQSQTSMKM